MMQPQMQVAAAQPPVFVTVGSPDFVMTGFARDRITRLRNCSICLIVVGCVLILDPLGVWVGSQVSGTLSLVTGAFGVTILRGGGKISVSRACCGCSRRPRTALAQYRRWAIAALVFALMAFIVSIAMTAFWFSVAANMCATVCHYDYSYGGRGNRHCDYGDPSCAFYNAAGSFAVIMMCCNIVATVALSIIINNVMTLRREVTEQESQQPPQQQVYTTGGLVASTLPVPSAPQQYAVQYPPQQVPQYPQVQYPAPQQAPAQYPQAPAQYPQAIVMGTVVQEQVAPPAAATATATAAVSKEEEEAPGARLLADSAPPCPKCHATGEMGRFCSMCGADMS